MRKPLILILAGCLFLPGCDDTKALQMARDANSILDSYEKELERKLAAEQAAYRVQAQIESEAQRSQIYSSLEQERLERARSLALDFIEGKRSVARWRDSVREYARADYTLQRESLLQDLNSQMKFLERIQALEIDRQKVAALKKAFGVLAEKPDFNASVKDLTEFAQEAKTDLDKQICASLAQQVTEKKAEVETASGEAAKRKAETALKALQDAEAEKACKAGAT